MSQSVLTNQADSSKRIKILTNSEYRDIYELPVFSDKDQSYFFSMDEYEMSYFKSAKPVVPKIFFALQLGYFKASQRFFNFTLDEVFEWFNKHDLEFINSIPSTDCSIGIPNNIFIKGKKNTFSERIFQQLRMNFNNLGNEGGLFIVVGKKR